MNGGGAIAEKTIEGWLVLGNIGQDLEGSINESMSTLRNG